MTNPDEGTFDPDQAALRCAAQSDAALCTIVRLDGSFSRRVGAQIAILTDRTCVGSLADGCLESELASQADEARARAEPRIVRYGAGSSIVDFRLPCGSGVDILIDPEPDRDMLGDAVARLDAREAATVPLAATGEGLLAERSYEPSLRLVVLGESLEARELDRLARAYGIETVCPEPGKDLALGRKPALSADAWTAIVLLFHDHEWERALLDWALDTTAFFIGAIGGKASREARIAMLRGQGRGSEEIARVRGPVGLIGHTRDARTLALSILSEVVGAYEGMRGRAADRPQ
ncbi:hypothetical protein GCM10011371_02640 [Novosphingobium marinum]|uniref:Xanthine dehydrogenase accessory factor n=1 Tax=Novosphingobium marinum TaxID=1514948 RepID=A0A7Y9XSV9_9SPHN|nr:XdhC family protein [Novosphingobium marinum]NYH93956.1 xanthine dehydrogenase accessory factor [Novosphingobium marinum]GGC18550.1 hypothetical protein GCM10011371_02640 [Novosphingobium marinum]